MKKFFQLTLCLGTLAPGLGFTSPAPYFNGIMIAGAIGATAAQFQLTEKLFVSLPPDLYFESYDKSNLYGNSPMGLVSVGYSYQCDNAMTLGGYFTAGYTDAKSTQNRSMSDLANPNNSIVFTTKSTLQLTNDFSLLLKGGYVWQHTTHFYGLIGPRWGNFKTTAQSDNIYDDNQNIIEGSDSQTHSNYVLGLTLGLGIQQMLTSRYSWALEYAYTTYGSLNMPNAEGIFYLNERALDQTDFAYHPNAKSMTNTLMFMIAYRL